MDENIPLTRVEVKVDFTDSKIQNILKYMYNNLNLIIKENNITKDNIILVTTHLMQLIEKFPSLKGSEKKFIIIYILDNFVTDNIKTDEQIIILNYIDLFLPSIIDLLIDVDNKNIVINTKKCFSWCFK